MSIITFVTATSVLVAQGTDSEGYMVAVAAAMEAPAIVSALGLLARFGKAGTAARMDAGLWREILLNGFILLLVGAFLIGVATDKPGMTRIEAFIVAPYQGVLCPFLLDLGLVAGRWLRGMRAERF